MEKLDLIYGICEEWANDNGLDFNDVIKVNPDSLFYICEMESSSLEMKVLLKLSLKLEEHGLTLYSIDRWRDNPYLEIWIV